MKRGHAGAHPQHDEDHEAERQNVAEDRHQAGSPHFVQRVHIGGDASDQAADGVAVVRRRRPAVAGAPSARGADRTWRTGRFAASSTFGRIRTGIRSERWRDTARKSGPGRSRRRARASDPERRRELVAVGQVSVDGQLGEQRPRRPAAWIGASRKTSDTMTAPR